MNKSSFILSFSIVFGAFSLIAQAQSLDEKLNKASVIYVAPLTDFDYYALQVRKGQSKGTYTHDASFEVGDYVDHISDPTISFEIVGWLSDERLAAINERMINQLQKEYGNDKVKSWPEGTKTKQTEFWDQKKIDCEYYIIFKRISSACPVLVEYIDAFSTDPDIKPKIAGGSDMFTINLYEKVKPGKKGKAIVETKCKIFEGVEPVVINSNLQEAASTVVAMANENFLKVVETALDEFLASIKEQ